MSTSDVLSAIRSRRSIRRYLPDPIEGEKIDQLLEAGLRAPSSRGINPWELVVVTDPRTLGELSRCKAHGAGFLKEAPLGIVICADPAKSDVWIEDASVVASFILLAAESLGLGACWIQVRGRMDEEGRLASQRVRESLGLPSGLEVEAIVAVGYPAENKMPHPKEGLNWEKVHNNRYGNPYR